MAWSYYCKIVAWTILATAGSAIMTWAVGSCKSWVMVTFVQVPMTLTLYPPFEYYWTWKPPCILN